MRRFCVVGLTAAACSVADPAIDLHQPGTLKPLRTHTVADPVFEDPASFEPLPAPTPSSWRTLVDESGQSYLDYLDTFPRRPRDERLYLLPLGELGTAFVVDAGATYVVRTPEPEAMTALLTAYFGVPTEVLPGIPVGEVIEPARVRDGHEQFRAQALLDATKPLAPRDAYSMTALMVQDLFFDDRQEFGFGFGEHRGGQAVLSFARLDPAVSGQPGAPDELERVPLRAFKLLVHEVGHTFGWTHCTAYRCVMNGMADLDELDETPLHLCPECLRKLMYAQPTDPTDRYAMLAQIYDDLGLEQPRRWVDDRLHRLEREPARPDVP